MKKLFALIVGAMLIATPAVAGGGRGHGGGWHGGGGHWHGGYSGYRGGGYGYGPGYGYGWAAPAIVGGVIIGGAIAADQCWRVSGYYPYRRVWVCN